MSPRISLMSRSSVGQDKLIEAFNRRTDAPNPNAYPNHVAFLHAHLEYLRKEYEDNANKTARLLRGMKSNGNSAVVAHMSGLVSGRKGYARFLKAGMNQTATLIQYESGYFF